MNRLPGAWCVRPPVLCLSALVALLFSPLLSSTCGAASRLSGVAELTDAEMSSLSARMFTPRPQRIDVPPRVVNIRHLPVVGDQGGLGSCAAFAVFYYAKTYEEAREHDWVRPDPAVNPERVASPAFGFRATSKGESASGLLAINHYSGAATLVDKGCTSWSVTPYSSTIDIGAWPTEEEWRAAMPWRSRAFGRLPDIHTPTGLRLLKEHLARGNVAVITIMVRPTFDEYPGWIGDDNGVYYTDADLDWRDSHALTVIGFDDSLTYFDEDRQETRSGALLAVNSWGTDWGVHVPEAGSAGFIWIAYDYVTAGNIQGNSALILTDRLEYEPKLWAKATFSNPTPEFLKLNALGDLSPTFYEPSWQQRALPNTRNMNPAVSTPILTDLTDFLDLQTWSVTLSAFDSAGLADVYGRQEGHTIDSFGLVHVNGSEVWSADPPVTTGGGTLETATARIDMLTADPLLFAGLHIREGSAAWGDLDGDGLPDLAVTGSHYPADGSGPVPVTRVYRQQADGSFVDALLDLPGTTAGAVVWADMTNNGYLDLAVAGEASTRLFHNPGDGTLLDSGLQLPPAAARQAIIADIDMDGRPDLILASAEGTHVLFQTNGGNFTEAVHQLPPLTDGAVGVADVDGNGFPDIAMIGNSTDGTLGAVWRNNGDRTFTRDNEAGLPTLQGGDLVFADWNADGWPDLAVCGRQGYSMTATTQILRNRGDGTFVASPAVFTGLSAARLAWADLDASGRPDLVVIGREYVADATTIADAYQSRTLFLRNHGDGIFKQLELPSVGVAGGDWKPPLLAVADVTGNCAPDIFVGGSAGAVNETNPASIPALLIRNQSPTFPFVSRSNTPPTAPTGLVAEPLSGGYVRLSWEAATDAETDSAGLIYILRIGTTPAGGEIVSGCLAPGAIGNLYKRQITLREMPSGVLHVSVAAVDASAAVSSWSPSVPFTIGAYTAKSLLFIEAQPHYGGTTTPEVGTHLMDRNAAIDVEASPAPGFQFVNWDGAVADPDAAATTTAMADDSLLVANFEKKSETVDLAWRRRTASASWSGRGNFPLLSHNGRLWVLGGSEFGTLRNDVWSSTDGASWRRETAAAGWSPRYRHAAVVFNDRMWVLGGNSSSGAEADIWSSSDGVTWTYEGDAGWGPRIEHAAVVHDGAIYVMAGWKGGSYPRDVWRSTDGRTWSEVTGWASWARRTSPMLVSFNGAMWLMGGWVSQIQGPSYYVNDVWRSTDGLVWEKMMDAAPWAGRNEAGLVTLNNRLWVMGGYGAAGWLNDVWSSTNGIEWVRATDADWQTRAGAGHVVHNNMIYVSGGGTVLNDVWSGGPKPPPAGSWALTLATFHVPDGTVNPNQGGTTLPPPGRYTDFGTTPFNLKAVPHPGWYFDGWDGPVDSPATATTSLTPSGDMTVTARFVKTELQPGGVLTLNSEPAEGGDIEPGGQLHWVILGDTLELRAQPSFGWQFSHWTGPVENPTTPVTNLHFTTSTEVTAHFAFEGFRPVAALAGGRVHSLIVDVAGNVWSVGDNRYGQLGVNGIASSSTLYALSPLADVTAIAAGAEHTVALQRNGTVWTWGIGFNGQSGRLFQPTAAVEPGVVPDLPVIKAVAAGEQFTLALAHDGTVWGWGMASHGELTDAAVTQRNTPVQLLGPHGNGVLTEVVGIAAGSRHGLALTEDAEVYAWGHNDRGQLGDGTTFSRRHPTRVSDLVSVRLLAAGGSAGSGDAHSVAVLADGTVRAWGANTAGQLGDGSWEDRPSPVAVSNAANIVQIACGTRHTVALDRDGGVWTWGSNTFGQLGNTGRDDRPYPQLVGGLPAIASIGAGENTTLAIGVDGTVYTWGQNDAGQVGGGPVEDILTPTALAGFNTTSEAVTVSIDVNVGDGATTVPLPGNYLGWTGAVLPVSALPGTRYAFDQWQGPVAEPSTADTTVEIAGATACRADFSLLPGIDPQLHLSASPAAAGFLEPAAGISSDSVGETVALTAKANHRHAFVGWTGDIVESASEAVNVVMDRDRWVVANFTPLPFSTQPRIVAGSTHSLLLSADGTVTAWGSNDSGQLGRSVFERSGLPAPVLNPDGDDTLGWIVDLAAGWAHSLALTADGTVLAWGSNQHGQCGQGLDWDAPDACPLPVQVPDSTGDNALTGIRAVAAGAYFSAALDIDGNVWTWGRNNRGQLGTGDRTDRALPVQPGAVTVRLDLPPMTAIAAGTSFMLALAEDGSVWSWGANDYGQLGNGTTTSSLTPIQVVGLNQVIAIGAGTPVYGDFGVALRDDGTLWTWGGNHDGNLGTGDTENSLLPVHIEGLSGITDFAVGHSHVVAVDDNDQVWSWGSGYYGQLGSGSQANALLPTLVATLPQPVHHMAAGAAHTLAMLANGDVYAWGSDDYGQLGNRQLSLRQTTPGQTGQTGGDMNAASTTLIIRSEPPEDGTTRPANGIYWFPTGSEVGVEAIPAQNRRFAEWQGLVGNSDSAATTTVMSMAQELIAHFEPLPHILRLDDVVCQPDGDVVLPLLLTPGAEDFAGVQADILVPDPLIVVDVRLGLTFPDDSFDLAWSTTRVDGATRLRLVIFGLTPGLTPPETERTLALIRIAANSDAPADMYPVRFATGNGRDNTPLPLTMASPAGDHLVTSPESSDGSVQVERLQAATVALRIRCAAYPGDAMDDATFTAYDSSSLVRLDRSYVAEIWLRDRGTTPVGIAGAGIDIEFDENMVTIQGLHHGVDFADAATGTFEANRVTNFGGITDTADPEIPAPGAEHWVRLGWLELQPLTQGTAEIALLPDSSWFTKPDGTLHTSSSVAWLETPALVNQDVNQPPFAADADQLTVQRGGSLLIELPGGDPNGCDSLVFTIVTPPQNGILNASESAGQFEFVPAAGFTGVDSFTYRVSDGELESGVGTVNLRVHLAFTLDLQPGWNFISLPLQPLDIAPASLFAPLGLDPPPKLWQWVQKVPGRGSFKVADEVMPHTAYWIFLELSAPSSLTVPGMPADGTIPLQRGWQAVGAGVQVNGLPAEDVRQCYRWNGTRFEPVDAMTPGVGYWLLATDECMLNVGVYDDE